jgi:cysteinyl-tRNA synthetase
MVLKLYNTLSRKKEELKPIHSNGVGFYTCGPTVYNYAHIGNLRTYLFEDILQRTIEYNGHEVHRVMNITDVGHMTGDTDAGDDKLEKEAAEQKKSVEDIADFYTNAFMDDLVKLNIQLPGIIAPASKYVGEDISLIQMLFEKSFAYDTPSAVYFDVSKFPNYGALSRQSLEEKLVGAREEVIVDDEKRNPADFVLWFKLVGKYKEHILHWPSKWGEGFPGWHIECSAISRHFLGQPFDIHAGGVDLIGTHHTNEIAQSEAAYDVPLASIWMHGEHLQIDGGKMAKSEGNFLTLADLEAKGYPPLIFRYLALGAHYRTPLNFTWESLDAAKNALERLYEMAYELSHMPAGQSKNDNSAKEYEASFHEAVNDDLNVPKALAVVHEVFGDNDMGNIQKIELIEKFDTVFGLRFDIPIEAEPDPKMPEMTSKYQELRSNKQFIQSDALRKEIEGLGYTVRDTAEGAVVVKKFFP